MILSDWENLFESEITKIATSEDPAHDILHFRRVVASAKKLAIQEGADLNIVVPAAWLHDFVIVPKDSPLRSQASRMSAQKAIAYLNSINYPSEYFEAIAHAIEGHSFSANIEVKTLEAKVVQDADRLDGLGAIGIARCFATAGILKRPFYEAEDPFCENRELNDAVYTVDHFYKKLFKVAETLKTVSAQREGLHRVKMMRSYLDQLKFEIYPSKIDSAYAEDQSL
jgi:uncharacterized protein